MSDTDTTIVMEAISETPPLGSSYNSHVIGAIHQALQELDALGGDDDDQEPWNDNPRPVPATMPDINSPASLLLAKLSGISGSAGNPVDVSLSSVLREVTITLPSMIVFDAWCEELGIESSGRTDDLGSLVVASAGGDNTWHLRLYYHVGP